MCGWVGGWGGGWLGGGMGVMYKWVYGSTHVRVCGRVVRL